MRIQPNQAASISAVLLSQRKSCRNSCNRRYIFEQICLSNLALLIRSAKTPGSTVTGCISPTLRPPIAAGQHRPLCLHRSAQLGLHRLVPAEKWRTSRSHTSCIVPLTGHAQPRSTAPCLPPVGASMALHIASCSDPAVEALSSEVPECLISELATSDLLSDRPPSLIDG